MWFQTAVDKMWGPIMEWIHYPHSGKGALMEAYEGLRPQEKAQLDADVAQVFHKVHGGDTAIMYRYRDRPGSMGGASVSTVEPSYIGRDKYTAYEVHASDVMVHWAQDELPLNGKAFGHEKEVILKPHANPKVIDPV